MFGPISFGQVQMAVAPATSRSQSSRTDSSLQNIRSVSAPEVRIPMPQETPRAPVQTQGSMAHSWLLNACKGVLKTEAVLVGSSAAIGLAVSLVKFGIAKSAYEPHDPEPRFPTLLFVGVTGWGSVISNILLLLSSSRPQQPDIPAFQAEPSHIEAIRVLTPRPESIQHLKLPDILDPDQVARMNAYVSHGPDQDFPPMRITYSADEECPITGLEMPRPSESSPSNVALSNEASSSTKPEDFIQRPLIAIMKYGELGRTPVFDHDALITSWITDGKNPLTGTLLSLADFRTPHI